MPRAKRGFKARRRHNRIMRFAKGYYSARGRQFASAIEQVHNAWQDAYAHRKARKRDFRRLWIARINAAARQNGFSYSKLMSSLRVSSVWSSIARCLRISRCVIPAASKPWSMRCAERHRA
jgi:large subunit ribosomal protein L20